MTVVFLFAAVSAFVPPQTPPPGLPQAITRLNAQDPAGALKIAEDVVAREPGNARAWRVLGVAAKGTKDLDRALAAFARSLKIEPASPPGLYNMGAVYAVKGDRDHGFEWLGKARATRKIDMTQIQGDADLASLRDDPRFAALLPTAADFAAPFVEEVKILREWDGEAANDQFGWIARPIGDVDRDGITDVVTSAPGGPTSPGRVYLYSTKSGALLWKVDGNAGDTLGSGVEGAGDTNKDGIPDVIASAPGTGHAYVNQDGRDDLIVGAWQYGAVTGSGGRAYLYSGKDGSLLKTYTGKIPGETFGFDAVGVGDIDGDGTIDLLITSAWSGIRGFHSGRMFVISSGIR